MNDTFNTFFNTWNGKPCEAEDASALDQCMDEVFKYLDLLAIDRSAIRNKFAYQVWSNPTATTRKYFELFPNTATFIPQVGDIAVFKIATGIPVGHISVVAPGSNVMNLVSFDQNWDTIHYNLGKDKNGNLIPYCRIVVHPNYYGVAGFLRRKNQQMKPTYEELEQRLNRAHEEAYGGDNDSVARSKIKVILA